MSYLYVALGGAVGAAGRYAVSCFPVKAAFPVQTFLTNVLGALLIGFIAGVAEERAGPSAEAVLFWKTGVCGGFTTFSTFSLESLTLLERGSYLTAGIYILLSVACCLAGAYMGQKFASLLF